MLKKLKKIISNKKLLRTLRVLDRIKVYVFLAIGSALIVLAWLYFKDANVAVLNPEGIIASKQRDLIMFAVVLMIIVVLPVLAMSFIIAWRYREGAKHKAKYSPDLEGNVVAESVWWGIPLIIIAILSVVTWTSTHELDHFKPLDSDAEPVKVQVVALEWKWLFIYPEYDIATVNYLQIPEQRPINFTITSDAPMNSFWVPQLGGQIYAMSGMSTKLHLMADKPGVYHGMSANISGEGFSEMDFKVQSVTENDFMNWVSQTQSGEQYLSQESYDVLARPSVSDEDMTYADVEEGIYNAVVAKYMGDVDESENYHEGAH